MKDKDILKKRAEIIAKPIIESRKSSQIRYLIFKRKSNFYAIHESEILFIDNSSKIRLLTNIKDPFIGVANYKGTIYNVFDFVKEHNKKIEHINYGVVFLKNSFNCILFDKVIGISYFKKGEIIKILEIKSQYFKGSLSFENNLVLLVDVDKIS